MSKWGNGPTGESEADEDGKGEDEIKGFDVSDKKMDNEEIDILDGRGFKNDDDDVCDFDDGEIENETVEDESPDNSHAER